MLSDFLLFYAKNGVLKPLRKSCYRKFCRRKEGSVFTVTTNYGAVMKVVIGDKVDNNIFLNKYFDSGTSEVMSKFSRMSNCLVDVGCNIGYFSCLFGKLNLDAYIHCIDPNPQMIERTKENLQLSEVGSYKTYNYGVGSKEDILKFYLPQRRHSLGSFIKQEKDVGKMDVFNVQVRPLKDIVCINELDNAVLKIDAEGFEWEVLSGMSDSDVQKFNYIIFEFATEVLKYSENSEKNIFAIPWFKDYQIYKIMLDGSLEPFSHVEGEWYSLNICMVRKGAETVS
jgi:FkbM family methyltransferase